MISLGELYQDQGRLDAARESFSTCLEVAADSDSTTGRWAALGGLARIAAASGEPLVARGLFRQAIDAGWRVGWRRWLKHKPDLEPLHDEPEFQAIVAEIEADMAEQLERVRQMERDGVPEPVLDLSAATP